MRGIPRQLLTELNQKGYKVENAPPLDVGAGKLVYSAECVVYGKKTEAALLYSKNSMEKSRSPTDQSAKSNCAWNHQREFQLFTELKGKEHKNIINMIDFFGPCNAHGPCIVLEKIEPLGFDILKVVKQYQGACERALPVAQWLHYLDQIIEGVKHLHRLGWGHCNLKPENVLVGDGHSVKITDFGMAKKLRVDRHPGRFAAYAPPEFAKRRNTVQESADAWLIGAMMCVLFADMQVAFRSQTGKLIEVTDPRGTCQAIKQKYGRQVDNIMVEVIDGLLQQDPTDRWTIAKLEEWCLMTKGEQHSDVEFKCLPGAAAEGETASLFSKAPPLDRLVKAFGFRVTSESEFVGKYIGSHFGEDGVLIRGPSKVVDFRKFAGVTVLFIDRHPKMLHFPRANDQVQVSDWIYLMIHEDVETEHIDIHHRTREACKDGIEIWLEFDWFEFPERCVGATMQDMQLGNQFGISAHFVARALHEDEGTPVQDSAEQSSAIKFVEVNAQTRIYPGDRALVCRVPDRKTGRSNSILTDEVLAPLFEESIFRERLNLQDEDLWIQWRGNCSSTFDALMWLDE